jgi:hypothetical protein
MKLTIVIDTEDPDGVSDSYKIVDHFHKKVCRRGMHGRQISYTKIPFIKMLRKFAAEVIKAEKDGEDGKGLRLSKIFADAEFANDKNQVSL